MNSAVIGAGLRAAISLFIKVPTEARMALSAAAFVASGSKYLGSGKDVCAQKDVGAGVNVCANVDVCPCKDMRAGDKFGARIDVGAYKQLRPGKHLGTNRSVRVN